ncbi:MAG TPA: lectin-like protein [Gemmatimonadaceae bacterium]|nr:lectin-like protein [Gemmatimonadaceae bacterium]
MFADRQEQAELEAIVDDVWVGYSDRLTEGTFIATTLEPIGDYVASGSTAWASGEPNRQTAAEDCAEIILEGGLNDNDCANTRMFVCECDAYANDPSRY